METQELWPLKKIKKKNYERADCKYHQPNDVRMGNLMGIQMEVDLSQLKHNKIIS